MNKWDERFLDMAELVATWSKDPSTKIGAVCVEPQSKRILSMGYNGFPRGIADLDWRYEDKEVKYSLVVHAEANAIYNATSNGVSLEGSTIYVAGLPSCSDCAKGIIQVGIKRVVCRAPNIPSHWGEHWKKSKAMYREACIDFLLTSGIEGGIEAGVEYEPNE